MEKRMGLGLFIIVVVSYLKKEILKMVKKKVFGKILTVMVN